MGITIDGAGTITGLDADGISAQPVFPGQVLQVVSTTKTDSQSTTSTSYVDITGLSATITPISINSKILVLCNTTLSIDGDNNAFVQLVRNSTAIANNTSASNPSFAQINGNLNPFRFSASQQSISFLDEPSLTSPVTYKLQFRAQGFTAFVNIRALDTLNGGSSTITLMEIAA